MVHVLVVVSFRLFAVAISAAFILFASSYASSGLGFLLVGGLGALGLALSLACTSVDVIAPWITPGAGSRETLLMYLTDSTLEVMGCVSVLIASCMCVGLSLHKGDPRMGAFWAVYSAFLFADMGRRVGKACTTHQRLLDQLFPAGPCQ